LADLSNPLGGILPPLHDLDMKPLTAPAPASSTPHVEHICVKTKTVTIETDVKSLVDLLHIINTHEYDAQTQYNIDLKSLHAIKEEMTLLNDMIGLDSIKTAVMNQLLYFIQNLGSGDAGNGDFKHTVICGPPGTGKTEIAKLIGKMYSKVGILKNNVFKKVTRSDLIAGYLGQTAIKTNKVVTECIGGVLFIDEAYSLAAQDGNDSFSKECLDTLCEALSDHKTDLMVIIAGYEDDLNGTFFKVNRGLESRFIWKFRMEPYTADELMRIFEKKIADNGWQLNIESPILRAWFTRNHKKFVHYGRDMEQLFTYAKIHHSRRIYGKPTDLRKKITIDDLTCAFDVFETNKKKEAVPDYLQNIYV
jgi:Holliday junction resolvasome RuvABC ATP-dependent DNA helicase subunit